MAAGESTTTFRPIRLQTSVVRRAKSNDVEAINLIFKQFASADEDILLCHYLGTKGLFGLGHSSFGCLTKRRVMSVTVGIFGEIICRDAFLENVSSGVVYQPSKFLLYVAYVVIGACALLLGAAPAILGSTQTIPFGVVLLPILAGLLFFLFAHWATMLFYSLNKCGVVFIIQEKYTVYLFCDRSILGKANQIYKAVGQERDTRLDKVVRA